MIDGLTINLGGTDYIVPPLNLNGLEKYLKLMDRINETKDDPLAQINITAEAALIALRRNYPDLTIEDIKEMLDTESSIRLFGVVAEVSGLKKKIVLEPNP